jgi:hypothetical protein
MTYCRRTDNAMVEMLEGGTHTTIAEIAAAENINESYVSCALRLTLLAPDIVEAIQGGRQCALRNSQAPCSQACERGGNEHSE